MAGVPYRTAQADSSFGRSASLAKENVGAVQLAICSRPVAGSGMNGAAQNLTEKDSSYFQLSSSHVGHSRKITGPMMTQQT